LTHKRTYNKAVKIKRPNNDKQNTTQKA
jgi:hypothetical protein